MTPNDMVIRFMKLTHFTSTTKETYTDKPAMILDGENYIVPGDDGTGFLLCAGQPDGEDSETVDSYETFEKLASWLKANDRGQARRDNPKA